jgi:hypothetical protein
VDVVILLVFVSLVLVAGAIIFMLSRVHGGDFEHGDRLSLLPLEEEGRPTDRIPDPDVHPDPEKGATEAP